MAIYQFRFMYIQYELDLDSFEYIYCDWKHWSFVLRYVHKDTFFLSQMPD